MKILIYQPRLSYFTGGGEIYPLQTAKFFAKLGHDVTILTTRAPFLTPSAYFLNFIKENPAVKIDYLDLDDNYKKIYDEPAGINWKRWDNESMWVARPAYEYMTKHKFDVVTIHCIIDRLAVPFGQDHVLHLHGTPSELNYVCKLILEEETHYLAVSEKVASKWIELGAYPHIKISTNAIDDNVFYPNPQIKKDIDFLFVGRLIPIKGIQFILQALKIIKDTHNITPNFTIVGDGPFKEELKEITKQLNLENQVSFSGLVSQEDLIKSYQRAKVAVLPSFDKEGIMSTLLEASSCKVPCITTKGTSMEEFAKNDENALLVNPEDALDLSEKMYELFTNQELATKISTNAYNEVMKKYTWLAKAKELIELYKEVK